MRQEIAFRPNLHTVHVDGGMLVPFLDMLNEKKLAIIKPTLIWCLDNKQYNIILINDIHVLSISHP